MNQNKAAAEQRRERIIALRQKYPCMTTVAIGLEAGVTREWVRQVLVKVGLETRHKVQRQSYVCLECGSAFVPDSRKKNPLFCSLGCQKQNHTVNAVCEECGKTFQRPDDHFRQNHGRIYCSKSCNGQWLGRVHGMGVRRVHRPRKYDYAELLRLRESMTPKQIAEMKGVTADVIRSAIANARRTKVPVQPMSIYLKACSRCRGDVYAYSEPVYVGQGILWDAGAKCLQCGREAGPAALQGRMPERPKERKGASIIGYR